MSGSLITHICVGPVRLSRDKKLRKKAVRQAKEIIDYVTRWDEADFGDTEIVVDARPLPPLPRLLKRYGNDDLDDWRCVLGVEPEKAVEELHTLWSGKDLPGDVNVREYRSYAHQPHVKLQILVAGDATWGDSPDGEGYRICRQSSLLGLFDLYGIR